MIAMDGDDLSRGWNRLSDVAPTSQGTKGEEDKSFSSPDRVLPFIKLQFFKMQI